MGNLLFQQAHHAVSHAKRVSSHGSSELPSAIDCAKNSLSSAFANSSDAEREQLYAMQSELHSLE